MEANLIDPRDPTRSWEVTIEPDGRISKMTEEIEGITDWKAEYGFLLEELIKQAQTINFLINRLLDIQKDLKQVISIDRTTLNSLKFAIPSIKQIVEDYDGITGFLSTNVSKRLSELENTQDKLNKKPKYQYE